MIRYFVALFFIIILYSCGNSKRENMILLLQEWGQKEIQFPAHPVFTIQGRDTIKYSLQNKYKVVTYVDSLGCMSCKLHLPEWEKFIQMVDSLHSDAVQFLFFFSSKKTNEIRRILLENRFKYPVCIDGQDSINIVNNFPVNANLQTFLLNQNNKVIAIGNPIHNPKIKELYLRILAGENFASKSYERLQTDIKLEQTSVDFGTFDWEQEQVASFELLNIGNEFLVIDQISTSCGCTVVEYSQEPVQSGGIFKFKVRYKAKYPEHFNKTITVHCNVNNSPLEFKIIGDAK